MIRELGEFDVWLRTLRNEIVWDNFHFVAEIWCAVGAGEAMMIGKLESTQKTRAGSHGWGVDEKTAVWYGDRKVAELAGGGSSRTGWVDGLGAIQLELGATACFQAGPQRLTVRDQTGVFWNAEDVVAGIYSEADHEPLCDFRIYPYLTGPSLWARFVRKNALPKYLPLFDSENRNRFCTLAEEVKRLVAFAAWRYCVQSALSRCNWV
jgi:hypothetical protein